ncbi:EamA family transporter [Natronorarus salvus]|uniref:EamA family transporter n=1 Tax=Natronorarus salvus TaxID=3117733 RepID=UPI002F2690C7
MVSTLGVGLALLAACCLAGQALTIRLATRHGRANDALLVVIAVNVVVLFPLAFLLDPNPTVTPRSIAAFAGAGIVGTMLGRAFFYEGIKRVGASRAEPVKASMPLHATVLAVLFLGERVTGPQFFGIVLIVAGIALVSWEQASTDRLEGNETPWLGLSLPLAAALFFGLEPILATIGFGEGTSVPMGLAIKTAAALVVFVGYLAWRGTLPGRADVPPGAFRWYVLAGVTSTTFLLAYYAGLAVSRVSVVVPIMQTSPLIVVVVSALLFKRIEKVTPRLIAAAGVIVCGGITVTLTG